MTDTINQSTQSATTLTDDAVKKWDRIGASMNGVNNQEALSAYETAQEIAPTTERQSIIDDIRARITETSLAVPISQQLKNIETLIPDANRVTIAFAKLLLDYVNDNTLPVVFDHKITQAIYDLKRGVNGYTHAPIPSELKAELNYPEWALHSIGLEISNALFFPPVKDSLPAAVAEKQTGFWGRIKKLVPEFLKR